MRGQTAVQDIIENSACLTSSRIEFIQLDVGNENSVSTAASKILSKFGYSSLFAIVNNAAIGFGLPLSDTLQTNIYGPKRVIEAFLPLLSLNGRIVNISSASGPMYVSKCIASGQPVKEFLDPTTTWNDLERRMDAIKSQADSAAEKDAYGLSKACLNMYTLQLSLQLQETSQILVNSCTPGFIDTDLTKGFGATNTPEMGTVSALHCLFAPAAEVGTGRYYGSDAVRSPLDRYRSPGDAPYNP